MRMKMPRAPNKIRHWPRKAQRRWLLAIARRIDHYMFAWRGVEIRINGVVVDRVYDVNGRAAG